MTLRSAPSASIGANSRGDGGGVYSPPRRAWRTDNFAADIVFPPGVGPTIGASCLLGAFRAKSVSFRQCGRHLRMIRRDCLRDCSSELSRVMLPHHNRLKVGRHFCERSASTRKATGHAPGAKGGGGDDTGGVGERRLLVTGFSQRTLEEHIKDVLFSTDAIAALEQFVRILPGDDIHRLALFLLTDKRDVPLFLRLFDGADAFALVADIQGGQLAKDRDLTLLHWAIACFPHRLSALHPNIEMLRQQTALGYNAIHYAAVHGINQTAVGHLLAHASVQSIRDLEADNTTLADGDGDDDEYDGAAHPNGSDEYAPSRGGSRTLGTMSVASTMAFSDDDDDDNESDDDEEERRYGSAKAKFRSGGGHALRRSRGSSRRTSIAAEAPDSSSSEGSFVVVSKGEATGASGVQSATLSREGSMTLPSRKPGAANEPILSDSIGARYDASDELEAETNTNVPPGDPPRRRDDDESAGAGVGSRQVSSWVASPTVAVPAGLSLRQRPPSTTPLHLALAYRHYETARALLVKSGYEANPTKRATPAATIELLRISGFPIGGISRRQRRRLAAAGGAPLDFPENDDDDDDDDDESNDSYTAVVPTLPKQRGPNEQPEECAIAVPDDAGGGICDVPETLPPPEDNPAAVAASRAAGSSRAALRDMAMPMDAYDLTLVHWSAAVKTGGAKGDVVAGECKKIIKSMEDPASAHIDSVKARFEHRFHLAYVWPSFAYFVAFLLWLILSTLVVQPHHSTMVNSAVEVEVKNCLPNYADHVALWANYADEENGEWCVTGSMHSPRLLEVVLEQRRVVRPGGGRDGRPGYVTVTYRPTEIRQLSATAIRETLSSGAQVFLHSLRMVTDVGYSGPDTFLGAAKEFGESATVARAQPEREEYRVYTEYVVQRPQQFRFSSRPGIRVNGSNASESHLPPVEEQRVFLKAITKGQFGHYVVPAVVSTWHTAGVAAAFMTALCWLAAVLDLWLAVNNLAQRVLKRTNRVLVRPTTGSIAAASFISVLQAAVCVQMTVLSNSMLTIESGILAPDPKWTHADAISSLRSSTQFLSVLMAVPALRFGRHTPSIDMCITVTVVAGACVAAAVWFVLSFYVPAHRVEAVAESVGVSTPSPLNLSGGGLMTILVVVGAFWIPVLLLRAHGLPTDTARQWWSDTLNTSVDRLCRRHHNPATVAGAGATGGPQKHRNASEVPLRKRLRRRWRSWRLQLKEAVYGKALRRATVATACTLLGALYAVCAVVFLSPYLVDSPFGADPASSRNGAGGGSIAGQVGAAAAIFGGGF